MKMLLVAILLAAGPVYVVAQENGGPAQNGNVYDGTAHQPSAGAVQSKEKAAGIAPPPAQQQRLNNDVEALGQRAEQNAAGAQTQATCAVDKTKC